MKYHYRQLKVALLIVSIVFSLMFLEACQVHSDRPPKLQNGAYYGVTKGPFRFRWWNYYERALSFADGLFWEDSIADLRQAIQQRSKDKRKARIYGLKFIDYFPHRELGVALYRMGRWEEALQELSASLQMEKSARAEFYLDQTRRSLIQEQQSDFKPPTIIIGSPLAPYLTNCLAIILQGEIQDDTFVYKVQINDKPLRMDVSAETVSFREKIQLQAGVNEIRILAEDLTGKTTERKIQIVADYLSPLLSVEKTQYQAQTGEQGAILDIYASDEAGLRTIWVGEEKIDAKGMLEFSKIIEMPASRQATDLSIKIEDLAGNVVETRVTPSAGDPAGIFNSPILIAENHWPPEMMADVKANGFPLRAQQTLPDDEPPEVHFSHTPLHRVTFLESVVIEGEATDSSGIESVLINGKNILSKSRQHCKFTYIQKLNLGENDVVIRVRDIYGNSYLGTLKFKRLQEAAKKPEARLRIAVFPFERKRPEIAEGLESFLKQHIRHRNRFVLKEIFNPREVFKDDDDVLNYALQKQLDGVLFGEIVERNNTLTINAWIKDPALDDALASVDAYCDDASGTHALNLLSRILDHKLTDELPLAEGAVQSIAQKSITVDIGTDHQVKKGMKIMVYEGGDPAHAQEEGMITDTIIGQGRLEKIQKTESLVLMDQNTAVDSVRPRNRVITR